jgi:hypothetical protein
MKAMARTGWMGVLGAALLISGTAGAQTPTSPDPAPQGGATPAGSGSATPAGPQGDIGAKPDGTADPKLDEARQRYQRGLQIYNEANYEAARVEFERAYQLVPSYKILYNIGLCYEQLGDYVQAQQTLQKYLQIGGAEISDERKKEVEKELNQIRPRIARARINLNVSGAEVYVNDACATEQGSGSVNCGVTTGTTRDILMNPGRHRVSARKSGYLPETQVVTVAGSDNATIDIALKPLPKLTEKKSNPWVIPTFIGWGVTLAGAGTAIATGVMANNAADEQTAAVNRFGATRQELDDAKDKTNTLGTVTDVLWIGSGVVAAASAYLTIRALSWKGEQGGANVEVGLNRVGLSGRF